MKPCETRWLKWLYAGSLWQTYPVILAPYLLLGLLFGQRLVADENEINSERAYSERPIISSDREHWAFRPISISPYPSVNAQAWPNVGFDYFILAALENAGLSPAPPADPATLLRRLKLDLLGLPITPEELAEYLEDDGPQAYERWVDRFLASPGYGERWAQPWLDLASFAETDGFEHDRVRSTAWQYRDWVIDALNSDMTFDEFVLRQLAGESHPDPKQRIATMFGLAGPDMPDINDQELRRHDRLNELTSTVGSALLGLQFHCAQCHDHKYDALSQGDFYRLRAVFEPAVPDLQRDKEFVAFSSASIHPSLAPRFYFRGEVRQPGPIVRPAVPRIAASTPEPIAYLDAKDPRVHFSKWLFEPENPLTSRVIVNRLWQSHFGKGLFENPSDVGVTVASPTNLETLDWLSTELRRQNWSLKSIQRLIVLSSTYRQASKSGGNDADWVDRIRLDRDNRLYSRFPRQRMDAEEIRDSMLFVAGLINFERGGEGVMPPIPDELVGTLLKGQWQVSELKSDHFRRSIYTFARRNLRDPILDAFDRPDAGASCPKRYRSTTSTQALQMLNSQFSLECGQGLRDQIFKESQAPNTDVSSRNDSSRNDGAIERLFLVALGRSPDLDERNWMTEFVQRGEGTSAKRWLAACLALLNTNEFIFID